MANRAGTVGPELQVLSAVTAVQTTDNIGFCGFSSGTLCALVYGGVDQRKGTSYQLVLN